MKSVGVFCGSSFGNDPQFKKSVEELGRYLAEQKITLIYGGANVGLMGVLADSVLNGGGEVIGIIPRFLQNREIAHPGLTQIIFCESMHERKKKMFELSQGFIALPGGLGTLDEIFEALSWRQLEIHKFPIAFLNINGFYDHLISFFKHMEKSQLLRPESRAHALFDSNASSIIERMKNS